MFFVAQRLIHLQSQVLVHVDSIKLSAVDHVSQVPVLHRFFGGVDRQRFAFLRIDRQLPETAPFGECVEGFLQLLVPEIILIRRDGPERRVVSEESKSNEVEAVPRYREIVGVENIQDWR